MLKGTSPLMMPSLLPFLFESMHNISAKFHLKCKLNSGNTCPLFRYGRTCSYL